MSHINLKHLEHMKLEKGAKFFGISKVKILLSITVLVKGKVFNSDTSSISEIDVLQTAQTNISLWCFDKHMVLFTK